MATGINVLIVDNDQHVLDIYKESISRLSSAPQIQTATTGMRAIALLDSLPFSLMLTDLNMPRMDGFQLLTIVRRKFPMLKTVAVTSVADEQYRVRAYAMGVDLYLEKPASKSEHRIFISCIESLLNSMEHAGFRGVQHKSLIDLVQMECISGSSSCLKITNGEVEGRLWINDGEVIDAEVEEMRGEEAFHHMMGWRTGGFEIGPSDPNRARVIFATIEGLLLDSAQANDERMAEGTTVAERRMASSALSSPMRRASRLKGVEFLCSVDRKDEHNFENWSTEEPDETARWIHDFSIRVHALGDRLQAGQVCSIEGYGPQRHLAIRPRGERDIAAGIQRNIRKEEVRDLMQRIASKWQQ
jgi:CheY-like chemotaxis protein